MRVGRDPCLPAGLILDQYRSPICFGTGSPDPFQWQSTDGLEIMDILYLTAYCDISLMKTDLKGIASILDSNYYFGIANAHWSALLDANVDRESIDLPSKGEVSTSNKSISLLLFDSHRQTPAIQIELEILSNSKSTIGRYFLLLDENNEFIDEFFYTDEHTPS